MLVSNDVLRSALSGGSSDEGLAKLGAPRGEIEGNQLHREVYRNTSEESYSEF